jgi:hypothetical protein
MYIQDDMLEASPPPPELLKDLWKTPWRMPRRTPCIPWDALEVPLENILNDNLEDPL